MTRAQAIDEAVRLSLTPAEQLALLNQRVFTDAVRKALEYVRAEYRRIADDHRQQRPTP